MQDITPPRPRGQLRPDIRPDVSHGRAATRRVVYERRTTIISDIVPVAKPPLQVPATVVESVETVVSEPGLHKGAEAMSPTEKQLALERALVRARRNLTKERGRVRDWKRLSLIVIAAAFVLLTGYLSIDTWMTNERAKATETNNSVTLASGGTWSPEDEGRDEAAPSQEAVRNYTVAPALPRMLKIEKLGVNARILPMSINSDGSIQAPLNIYDAGWYTGSVKPGEIGAVFIDGHASGPTRQGLFGSLDTLAKGDTLQVEKGDGQTLTYRVAKVETVALDKVDMKKVLLPLNGVTRGLNLMTCTGEWDERAQTFDHRVIVYTEQITP